MRTRLNKPVIAGLDPAIQAALPGEAVDARVKPGHDGKGCRGND